MSFTHFTALISAILASSLIARPVAETKVRDLQALWDANAVPLIREIESKLPLEIRQDILSRRSSEVEPVLKPTIVFPASRLTTVAA